MGVDVRAKAAPTGPEPTTVELRASYIDVSWGQAHLLASGGGSHAGPPICAFHGTAYSGRTFAPLMRAMPNRRIIAIDTPGYGASTRPPEPWSLELYAAALTEVVDAAGDGEVDLLGYHTGALLAILVAASRPKLVRRLILIGVPFFPDMAERLDWRQRLARPMCLGETLDQFQERWDYLVTERARHASLAIGFAHFVDELKAYPYGFWAHEAAFSFDPSGTLEAVTQPTLILNPATPLAEASRRAGARIPQSSVLELSDLGHGVLDVAASELAHHIEAFTVG
jgi:pimeloyl-ACP methyl ester carboxylesterase